MTPTTNLRVLAVSLLSLLAALHSAAVETSFSPLPQETDRSRRPVTEEPKNDSSPSVLLLAIQANLVPAALQSRPKRPAELPETSRGVLDRPPRPLPQVMFPKNVTSSPLAPPLGAAQVAPFQMMDGWTDVCRGYYDWFGHFDTPFNCSKDSFIYCCGTCHYRFCCRESSRKLEQDNCKNYDDPDWAKPQTEVMILPDDGGSDPDFDPLKQETDRSRRPVTEEPKNDSSPSVLLLAIQANLVPAALQSRPKRPAELPETSRGVLERPPRPLPQVMFPKNVTSSPLAPPLGTAQVAPFQMMDGWMDVCRGYYDVMGHFDTPFNCSKDSFIYCCGTCHYRFCCRESSRKLEQDNCKNYNDPDWAKPQTEVMILPDDGGSDPDFDPLKLETDRSRRPVTEEPKNDSSPSVLLLAIQANLVPAALQSRPKRPAELPETSGGVLERPPRPLPQVMFPKNVTSSPLAPPLGAAQVAPFQMMDGWTDVCRGYYDVMGHFDSAFNCSKDSFIYCCGTCHYRFCCPESSRKLEQDNCKNYNSPDWAKPQTEVMIVPDDGGSDPDFDPLKQQSHNTGFVIGGVVVFMVAVAVGIKVVFNKVQHEANQRDLNMTRAFVDMLRHQPSPVQQDERNNSVALIVGDGQGTMGRAQKNLYAPGVPSKDNRLGNLQHNFIHSSGNSPKHTATIERTPRMNNVQLAAGGTLLSSKHNNTKSQPAFHQSLHNLAQLPPSYESATKPELNRYSSLKRLEKGLDEYSSGYCTTKRRPHTAQPALQSSQHHLHWGGDYTLSGRGTLPRHAARPWIPPPPSGMPASPTPNPYPLDPPEPQYNPNYDTLSKPPRKVKSTDQLLNMGDVSGTTGTLSRLSKNQQHQYYKAMAASNKNSNTQTLTRKPQDRQDRQERLLMSPDHLEERMGVGGIGVVDPYAAHTGGIVPTLPRQQKAQSQQNVCATPSLDRHHMIKMNSHPTSGREQERSAPMTGHMSGGVAWSGEMPGAGVVMGTGTLGGHSARRMAFAAKRQNTIEQLHFIPGGGGGGSAGSAGGGSQGIRTGSKNEVTV